MKFLVAVFLIVVTETFAFPVSQDYPNNDVPLLSENSWVFYGDWEEEIVGDIVAGDYFKIVFNGSRLPWRDSRYGQRAWEIFAEYKLNNGGQVHSEKLNGPDENNIMTKYILLPYGTNHISLWFKHWGYYSSYNYDSDYGKNYNANVEQPKHTIVFEASWAEDVYGELKRSEDVHIMYSPERLGNNSITAQVKFSENGSVHDYPLQSIPNHYFAATLNIPQDAEKIIIWFYKETDGAKQYDSDYGKNYKFDVSGEAGDVSLVK